MQRVWQLRRTMQVTLLLFVGGMLAVTGYTLWRLRVDAIHTGLDILALHARSFEDFLTQSLSATELAAANAQQSGNQPPDLRRIESSFALTLRHAPFLRSMSLLDQRSRIVASSNAANLGIVVPIEGYLPPEAATPQILRIGQPWSGRDFAVGHLATSEAQADGEVSSFVPVTWTLVRDGRSATLLLALNVDYFINHFSQAISVATGAVEVLRYDGTLLMSTDPAAHLGSLQGKLLRDLRLSEVESGQFEPDLGAGPVLTAFRASRLYPFVVVTHTRSEFALRHWRGEAKVILGIVFPALLVLSLSAGLFLRRQMEIAAQRASSERLQRINATVFDSSAEATLVTDVDGRIISTNHAFTRLTDYPLEDLAGRPFVELLDGESIMAFNQDIGSGPSSEKGNYATLEVQLRCRDDSLIWMEILSTPESDGKGEIAGYSRIGRNITGRKQSEKALIAAREEADLANKSKSEFLSSVSHELRTPLNVVLGYAQLFSADISLSSQKRENAREIENAGQLLLALVNGLLDLTRIESGKMALSMERIQVKTLTGGCFRLVEGMAQAAGITLIDDGGDGQNAVIHADAIRLQQVVVNFLTNAIKYNRPHGNVRLSYALMASQSPPAVRIAVADTGAGIAPHMQQRVFAPFDRLGFEKGSIEGTGIGLLIVKRIVDAMGGVVNFSSAEGQGSTFWAEFDVVEG